MGEQKEEKEKAVAKFSIKAHIKTNQREDGRMGAVWKTGNVWCLRVGSQAG
jgi:hypothetical protein